MRARTLAVVWLAFGVALWCGVFDLYVSRGAREYLQRQAEFELHMESAAPSMPVAMSRAKHLGLIAATLWATSAVVLGWLTIWLRGGTRSRHASRGSL